VGKQLGAPGAHVLEIDVAVSCKEAFAGPAMSQETGVMQELLSEIFPGSPLCLQIQAVTITRFATTIA
jgi:hypothetical protein